MLYITLRFLQEAGFKRLFPLAESNKDSGYNSNWCNWLKLFRCSSMAAVRVTDSWLGIAVMLRCNLKKDFFLFTIRYDPTLDPTRLLYLHKSLRVTAICEATG
jgi:hypothetical protein